MKNALKVLQNVPQQITQVYRIKREDLSKAIVWNNTCKFICIGGKSVYFRNLTEKGILRMGDLISDNNEFIVKSNHRLRVLNISPLDMCRLISVIIIDA